MRVPALQEVGDDGPGGCVYLEVRARHRDAAGVVFCVRGGGELARVKVDFIVFFFFFFFCACMACFSSWEKIRARKFREAGGGHFITVPAFVAPLNTASARPRRSDILNINICILPLTRWCGGGGHSRKTQHGHSGGRKRKSMRTSNNLNLR